MTETALTREEIRVSCSASRRRLAVVMQTVADRWTWERSRASGTALIPYGACGQWYNSRGADPVNDEATARTAMYAFVNGYDVAMQHFAQRLGLDTWRLREHPIARFLEPSYPDVRDYLRGEVECDHRVAERLAFAYASSWHRRGRGARGGDMGWL